MLALIAASGRGAVTMWGYPLWLFVGLWIVLFVPQHSRRVAAQARRRGLGRAYSSPWRLPSSPITRCCRLLDHRYRAAFFPGDALAATLTQRFHAATGGKKLRYVIGSMWLGGNIAHYSPDQPHVLIDGLPRRAPWIDLE